MEASAETISSLKIQLQLSESEAETVRSKMEAMEIELVDTISEKNGLSRELDNYQQQVRCMCVCIIL